MNNYVEYLTVSGEDVTFSFSPDMEINETEYEAVIHLNDNWFLPEKIVSQSMKPSVAYTVYGKEPIASAFQKMDADRIPCVIQSIASICCKIKKHNILHLRNVAADPAWIFYDSYKEDIAFLYIPTKAGIYPEEGTFESTLRKGLADLIRRSFEDLDFTLEILADELEDPELGLEYFKNYLQDEDSDLSDLSEKQQAKEIAAPNGSDKQPEDRVLCLKPLDLRHTQWIEVPRLPFLIGRKGSRVDGVISESKLVSRVHCRIDRKSDAYTIMDLASKNGTRVNQVRLEPETEYVLHAGDIIRIADVEFQLDWNYPSERKVEQWNG